MLFRGLLPRPAPPGRQQLSPGLLLGAVVVRLGTSSCCLWPPLVITSGAALHWVGCLGARLLAAHAGCTVGQCVPEACRLAATPCS